MDELEKRDSSSLIAGFQRLFVRLLEKRIVRDARATPISRWRDFARSVRSIAVVQRPNVPILQRRPPHLQTPAQNPESGASTRSTCPAPLPGARDETVHGHSH